MLVVVSQEEVGSSCRGSKLASAKAVAFVHLPMVVILAQFDVPGLSTMLLLQLWPGTIAAETTSASRYEASFMGNYERSA